MTATKRVRLDARVREAWPFLPRWAPAGSWWIGPTGERVRVNADGSADEFGELPRRWGIASSPTARRGTAP